MIKFLKTKTLLFFSTIVVGFFGSTGIAYGLLNVLTKPFEVFIEMLVFLVIGGGMSYVALSVSQNILSWVASPSFIKISYTGSDNQVVTAGWTVVRDFTNLLFILVMIVIGLATALRIREYQVQKTLPLLIVVALLINFTPVICGVIIDASNIFMNFFLSAGTEGYGEFVNFTGTAKGILTGAFKGILTHWKSFFDGTFLFQILFFIIFNIVCSFILLIFSGLLLIRHIALWILVILAPLAFFCYILPATRKIWSQWWHQFIQWCFVGVGGAFFLYLVQVMLGEIDKLSGPARLGAGDTFSLLGGLMIRSVPLILLAMGAFVTMSTSAMGANVVTGLAKKAQGKGLKMSKSFGRSTGLRWQRKLGAAVPFKQAGRRMAGRLDSLSAHRSNLGYDEQGNKVKTAGGWMKRRVGNLTNIGTRTAGGTWDTVTQGRFGAAGDDKRINTGKERAKGKTLNQNIKGLQDSNNPAELLGMIETMADDKQLKNAIKARPDLFAGARAEEMYEVAFLGGEKTKKAREAMEQAFAGNEKMLAMFANVKIRNDRARDVIDPTTGNKKRVGYYADGLSQDDMNKGYADQTEKIIAETKAEDISKLGVSKAQLAKVLVKRGDVHKMAKLSEDPEFADEVQKILDASGLNTGENVSKEELQKIMEGKTITTASGKQETVHVHGKTIKYFRSNAGQNLAYNMSNVNDSDLSEAMRALPRRAVSVPDLPSTIRKRAQGEKEEQKTVTKEKKKAEKERKRNIWSQYSDE